jgi:hypothetical protein
MICAAPSPPTVCSAAAAAAECCLATEQCERKVCQSVREIVWNNTSPTWSNLASSAHDGVWVVSQHKKIPLHGPSLRTKPSPRRCRRPHPPSLTRTISQLFHFFASYTELWRTMCPYPIVLHISQAIIGNNRTQLSYLTCRIGNLDPLW